MFMQSSRDSSVWKSLAVAFGDGLAFGVGMKLTQSAARHPETEPLPEPAPVAGRLGQIEQRISRIEQAPPAAPFDRKVLEAVVGAVDARLKEHAGQVERRLAEMEAKVALELKSLRQQDQAVISAAQSRVDEVQAWCRERIDAVRGDLAEEIGAVREQRPAGPAAGIEEQFEVLRAQLAAANGEIAELRRRVAGSDSASHALLLAIGEACRESAGRIPQPAVATPPPAPARPALQPELAAGAEAPPPAAEPNVAAPVGLWAGTSHEPATDPPVEVPPPAFTELRKPGRPWRVPLVSSFLLTIFGLVAFRFF